MEDYIQISKINDFLFCPMSIYFHSLYENFSDQLFHRTAQKVGKIKHKNIDQGKYSTLKRYLQGTPVYSSKYNLMGKIDLYDKEEKFLIERKFKVNKIYDGYKYQLYAQMFGLQEIGLEVKKMFIHSLSDNKRYEIPLPNKEELGKFEILIDEIKSFDPRKFNKKINKNKCDNCVYHELCNLD